MGYSLLQRAEHRWYLTKKRRRLHGDSFSILSSNCNGAMLLHDLGCRFDTPTVNLYFLPADFLRFAADPEKYLSAVPIPAAAEEKDFPVGKIEDIKVYFMHYTSFEQARDKWVERSQRVDLSRAFWMMTDQMGCTYEQIGQFDALPYAHKVIFTHKPYPEFASACYMPGFEEKGEVGVLSDWKDGKRKRRYLDDFDAVGFLNGEDWRKNKP